MWANSIAGVGSDPRQRLRLTPQMLATACLSAYSERARKNEERMGLQGRGMSALLWRLLYLALS
jgi:hypothetical protein